MAFVYYKYLTNYGNTIVAVSPTSFTLGPNEAQIFTNFEIPSIQPLYLYKESGGNVIANSDAQINNYLASIGQSSSGTIFTGYTATTNTRLNTIENNVIYLSGQTALKLNKTVFNTFTGTTAPATYLTKSAFNIYSGATLTNIQSRLLTSAFNSYSATTQSTINGKLNISDFNVYSANTITLIQSSQAGLDPKQSVRVATTVALSGGTTYIATGGTAGTGRFSSAPSRIDGIILANGNRVLVKNQAQPKQNGIYLVISSGTWNRSSDMDGTPATEVSAGNYTYVETGTTNKGSGWSVLGDGILTLNTDPIVWSQFNSATAYIQGVGILIAGQTISFDGSSVAGNALTWSGTQLNVNPTGGTLGTKFNTKLDVSAFNTYSASTLTNINSRVLKTVFSTYTGTTVPATYLAITNFNPYSATTLVNIQSRLLTTAFNTYSGNTANLINTKVGSANNGIRKSGTNVYLGGSLTGNTNLGLGTFNLILTGTTGTLRYGSDLSAQYNVRSHVDKGYVTGLTSTLLTTSAFNVYSAATLTNINSRLLTTAFNTYSGNTANLINTKVGSANNGIRKSGTNVYLGGSLTGNTNLGLGTFNLIFTGTTGTLRYGSDLSAQYNVRSLVDKGYVTGLTSQAITTANNGITKAGTSSNIHLGGALTGATTITSPATGSRLTFAGFPVQYAADLSANYSIRSLIDKAYFTGNTLQTSAQILVYASGTTNINITTAVSIPLNRSIRNNSTYYTYTGGTAIKILLAGTYDVSYTINTTNSNGTAHSVSATLYKNGSTITETTTSATLAGSTGSGAALVLPPTEITFAANDIVHLRGFRLIAGGGTVDTTANAVFLSIVKKY